MKQLTRSFIEDWDVLNKLCWTLERLGLAISNDVMMFWDHSSEEEYIEAIRNGGA